MENKYSALFSMDMSSIEARLAFYREVDGKTEEELAQLEEAYFEVSQPILQREIEEGLKGHFC